jgi:imidazolonepropionase-like amidohydrolase
MARTLLTGANLLDGRNPASADATVVVDGERIAAVLLAGEPVPHPDPRDRVVDLAGRTLMPGMATCHFHSTYDDLGSRPTPYGYDHAPARQALIAARNLRLALENGYTTAVSAGAAHDIDPAMTQAIADGLIAGPRFVPGSRELSTTGHSNDMTPWYWELRSTAAMRVCDGPEGFRQGVREEVRRGARMIKLFVTGGHGTSAPKERIELTRDELAAAIDAAHSRGVRIRGHIVNKPALLMAIELGIDVVDHGDDIDDEVVAALAETGTFLAPSTRLPEVTLERFGARLGPAADAMRADLDRMYALLPAADDAGVRIVLGDDYGAAGLPHGSYGDELVGYVERAGLDPLTVLRWATVNGAELTGRGHELGTVEAGKLADLVVVDGDPSVAIDVLAKPGAVTAVLKGGDVVVGTLP